MSGSNSSAPGASAAPLPEPPGAPGAPGAGSAPEPLGLTVHGVPVPDARVRSSTGGRLKALLILLACAAPVIASYFTYYVIRPEGRTNYGTLIQPLRTMPTDLPLASLGGEPVHSQSLRGQWLLVAVAPAACDSACESLLYMQRQLREMLGRERDRLDKVWLVTGEGEVRPELRSALEQGGVRLLRVPQEALARWLEPAAGQALQAHLYIVDPMGQWMMRAPPNPEPARVKRDLERLLRASSSWDQPGR